MEGTQGIYEQLTRELRPIERFLDEYGRTELDGILWAVAQKMTLGRLPHGNGHRPIALTDARPTGVPSHELVAPFIRCHDNVHVFICGQVFCRCGMRTWTQQYTEAIGAFENA